MMKAARCFEARAPRRQLLVRDKSSLAAVAVAESSSSHEHERRDDITSFSCSPPPPVPIYVAATRQHVGKTTTSMALLSGLRKRFGSSIGFMKPVGQECVEVLADDDGASARTMMIDKDAAAVREHFGIRHLSYEDMSPVVIPKGYTKDYLEGKISRYRHQESLIRTAYGRVSESSSPSGVVLLEGTGHCAVGSVVHASNAQVASWLGAKMVLVANGGIGRTFDELELNKALCDREGVEVCGVIVNKVRPDRVDQTREYVSRALRMHWGEDDILVGCVPDEPVLGDPTLGGYEKLFRTSLLSGDLYRHSRRYRTGDARLVTTSLEAFLRELKRSDSYDNSSNNNPQRRGTPPTLYVCHSSREDIVLGFLSSLRSEWRGGDDGEHREEERHDSALIVAGIDEYPLGGNVTDAILSVSEGLNAPPIMAVPMSPEAAMDAIRGYTPKLDRKDSDRARIAANHYERHIDFDLLLERSGCDLRRVQAMA